MDAQPVIDLSGQRVLILRGEFAGHEGICLGRSADGQAWAVSPDDRNEILQLEFPQDFGLLVDPAAGHGLN